MEWRAEGEDVDRRPEGDDGAGVVLPVRLPRSRPRDGSAAEWVSRAGRVPAARAGDDEGSGGLRRAQEGSRKGLWEGSGEGLWGGVAS